jgi:hypothetical protein
LRLEIDFLVLARCSQHRKTKRLKKRRNHIPRLQEDVLLRISNDRIQRQRLDLISASHLQGHFVDGLANASSSGQGVEQTLALRRQRHAGAVVYLADYRHVSRIVADHADQYLWLVCLILEALRYIDLDLLVVAPRNLNLSRKGNVDRTAAIHHLFRKRRDPRRRWPQSRIDGYAAEQHGGRGFPD